VAVRLQFNPSTGNLSFNAGTGKVQVVSSFFGGDHCCFLNPNAPLWDVGTTYNKDDEVSVLPTPSIVYRSIVSNNTGNIPSDANHWRSSSVFECGNTGWDSYFPYGGVGRTPRVYEVNITNAQFVFWVDCGLTIPSVVNGLHTLTAVVGVPHTWEGIIKGATTLNCSLFITLSLGNADTPTSGSIVLENAGTTPYSIALSACDIAGSGAGSNASFEWNPK
jgi:hypothetical protein